MRTARYLILVCCLALAAVPNPARAACEGYVPGPKPQNVGRDITGTDLDTIIERGFIEFAVYDNFPPYSWKEKGKPRGIDVDLGRLIAEDLGVKARFNLVAAGEDVDADLRFQVWKGPLIGGRVSNVMLHVPYSIDLACRNEQTVLTGQYFNETVAIAFRKDAYPDGGPTPAFFRYDTVAVENDTIADFYLSSLMGGQLTRNIRRFPTTAKAMEALARGEVKAAMGAKGQLEFGVTPEIAVHQPPLVGFSHGEWTLGVAVRHNYRPLAYRVGDAIRAAVEDGRLAKIFANYGLTYKKPEW